MGCDWFEAVDVVVWLVQKEMAVGGQYSSYGAVALVWGLVGLVRVNNGVIALWVMNIIDCG